MRDPLDIPDIDLAALARLRKAGLPTEEIAKRLSTTPGSAELAAALLPAPPPPPPVPAAVPVPPGGRLLPAPGGGRVPVQPASRAQEAQ
ncbi:hypothetical protein J0910_30550 [Nocardiopsis sp. CNT-189]|uniref:hypothetical protein n=1 Tax=Nocardiopsis oceanisediminis TaxID=2816862 RepID=UPI003B2B7C69